MNNDPSASPGEKSLRSELGDFFVDANRLITDWGKFHKPVSLVAIDGPEGATANAIYGTLRRPADPQCYELYHYKYHDADRGTVKRTIAVSLGPSVHLVHPPVLIDTTRLDRIGLVRGGPCFESSASCRAWDAVQRL